MAWASSNIDAVAIDVVTVDDDVPDVDADPKRNPILFGAAGIVLANPLLDLDRAGHSVYRTGELDQRPVAHELDHRARMGRDHWIDDLAPQRLEPSQGPGLVNSHEARVSDYISRQNCCEPPLNTLYGHP